LTSPVIRIRFNRIGYTGEFIIFNICIIGTGYVGLVVGTCLSDFGMNVTCIDKNKNKIEILNRGEIPIYETGLSDLVSKNIKLGRLHFSTNINKAVTESEIIFLAVGTPEGVNGTPNLSMLEEVSQQIASFINNYKVIAVKSTVTIGTAAKLKKIINENAPRDAQFDIVSNPEFLREGNAVYEFQNPDRIILGSDSDKAIALMKEIYKPLTQQNIPIVETDNVTAEMIKYSANTILALKISYINEVANLCDRVGADINQVSKAIGMDKRIGSKFLKSGPGYGGSCFPKDVKGFVNIAEKIGYDFKIGKAILEVNRHQRVVVVEKTLTAIGPLKNKTVCLLGLSFKPETDDIREAPALDIARLMLDQGAKIQAYDPAAMQQAKAVCPDIRYCENPYKAAKNADIVIIVTDWNEFLNLDLVKLRGLLTSPVLYDTRNIYDPEKIRRLGYTYICTGRP